MSATSDIHYETTIFPLKSDHLGPNQATLLHARTTHPSNVFYKAILYIHGYSDYYFHDHLCQRFLEHGYDFYAIDLRKCGRSIFSPDQDQYKHYCRDLREYDEEITLAIETVIKESRTKQRKLFLFGHSTGGLIATLYANAGDRRGDIEGLILNSPYLAAIETSIIDRVLLNMLITLNTSTDSVDLWYGRSLHISERGEWNFDVKKKPIDKIRLHGAFFAAIRRAQEEINKGRCQVQCPVLVLCSNRSMKAEKTWREDYANVDLILNVKTMQRAATMIGTQVTIHEVENGKHDLFLSKESVREKAFQLMFQWLTNLEDNWSISARI